ncbi:LysR family transcriptional regulator [Dryocola sp. BD626]|uniref:LysR family transcriptional regulator n=1 Tax=Dryocola sp. BD626 TaxID=3133273 RepID=UPI003F502FE4
MSETSVKRMDPLKIRKFDLNLLVVLDAVYTTGSVKNAATLLNTSSPSISQSLQKLKDYFGDPLFLRDGQKLRATTIAAKLHSKIKDSLESLVANIEDFEKDEYFNQLVIQCPIYLSIKIIPMISEFFESENINCEIVHRVSDNMVESFSDSLSLRQVDLVFGVNKNLGLATKSFSIGQEDLVFICRKNHPRLKAVFEEEDVDKETFCYIHTDELPAILTRQRVENKLLADRHFTLKSPSFISILSHVESSNSVAIVPRWLTQRFKDAFNIKVLSTDIPLPVVEIAMSYNKTNLNKKMNGRLFTYLSENFAGK